MSGSKPDGSLVDCGPSVVKYQSVETRLKISGPGSAKNKSGKQLLRSQKLYESSRTPPAQVLFKLGVISMLEPGQDHHFTIKMMIFFAYLRFWVSFDVFGNLGSKVGDQN